MTNEQLDALLPCPFCGGVARRRTLGPDEFGNEGGDVIECSTCEASSHVEFGYKENLVSSWNRRTDTALRARAEAAEADAERLAEDISFHRSQAASAMLRRYMNAPEDPHVEALCCRYGYGAVMDAASRLWARKDSVGAFYVGGCIGMKSDDEARAALADQVEKGE